MIKKEASRFETRTVGLGTPVYASHAIVDQTNRVHMLMCTLHNGARVAVSLNGLTATRYRGLAIITLERAA